MKKRALLLILCFFFLLQGCSQKVNLDDYPPSKEFTKEEALYIESPQEKTFENSCTIIDYSNISRGYISVKLKDNIKTKIKMQIIKDDEEYKYDILDNKFVGFPIHMGSGIYTIRILKNIQLNEYALVDSQDIDVQIEDEVQPFLYPNQIINYNENSEIIDKSFELCKGLKNDLQRIEKCYQWVIDTLEYDEKKVIEANKKYLIPDLDEVLKTKKGICFDYAALLCAMLRLQHIPARLICGNTDIEYHAWIEVYLEGEGWVNPEVYLDKEIWSRLDPTFADSKYDYDGTYDAIYYY